MYQAATISGARLCSGLPGVALKPVGTTTPAGTVAAVKLMAPLLGSEPNVPAPGAHMSVSGASAETDSAPSRPQPPSGCVQRICGIRDGPGLPIRPPNSRLSIAASESLKFELAWPN